jgi:Restriction endonuclease
VLTQFYAGKGAPALFFPHHPLRDNPVYPVDYNAVPAQANGMSGDRPSFLPFERAAAELRQQELARLADAVPPALEALRSLTPAPFRSEIALMLDRLGYAVLTDVSAYELMMMTKDGRKYIVACAPPADPGPIRTRDLARLHAAVVASTAEGGFYVTTRSFTQEAEEYAASAPLKLVDGPKLAAAMLRSRAGATLPETYRAMCRQCGDIVQHRLGRGETLPCGNAHPVAPTIALAAVLRQPPEKPGEDRHMPRPPQNRPRKNMSAKAQRRRKMRAHNHRVRARALQPPRDRG